MRTAPLTVSLLVFALIAQAFAVAAPAPCSTGHAAGNESVHMADHPHAATHQHHSAEAAIPQSDHVVQETSDDMDCCDDMVSVACLSNGCAAAGTIAMVLSAINPPSAAIGSSVIRNVVWLPAYPSPDSRIFRPPIA